MRTLSRTEKFIGILLVAVVLLVVFSTLTLNNQSEAQTTRTPDCKPDENTSAVYSRDGQQIITGSRDGVVRIWSANSGQPLSSFTFPNARPIRVAVTHKRDYIVTFDLSDITNQHTSTIVWDFDGKMVNTFPGSYGGVVADDLILTNGGGAKARLWDATTGKETRRLDDAFFNAAFSLDGTRVMDWNAPALGLPELWTFPDVQKSYTFPQIDPRTRETIKGKVPEVDTAALSWDNKRAAVAMNNNVFIWNLDQFALQSIISNAKGSALAFSPDGRFLLVEKGTLPDVHSDTVVILWDIEKQTESQHFPKLTRHHGGVKSLAFSWVGKQALITDDDGVVRTWDVNSGRPLFVFNACA